MGFKNTLSALKGNADEVAALIEKLGQNDDLRSIDIDLLLNRLRDIYDIVLDMKYSAVSDSQKGESSGVEIEIDQPEENPKVEEDEKATSEPGLSAENPPHVEQAKTRSVTNTATDSEKKTEDDQSKARAKAEKPVDMPAGPSFISERFKSQGHTLNEEMAKSSAKKDLGSSFSSKPINSITSAIGLNEKFELVNELFHGSQEKFNKAVEVLNMADSFVEAYNYLEQNFDWDMDNPYVQRILELVRRKLIVRKNEQ